MRVKLRKFLDQRILVRGVVTNLGDNKKNKNQKCIVLRDIKEEHFREHLCDHIWIKVGKNLIKNQEEIFRGDIIRFEGRVCQYEKSDGSVDYGLKTPTKFKIINRNKYLMREKIVGID